MNLDTFDTSSSSSSSDNVVKSTTLELTVNPGYVADWGAWEALRELIQNGLDEADAGHALTIERGKGDKRTIYIRNEGATLSRKTLLLGSTSKADGRSRGRFGEGYKLALLALTRAGISVQIRTGAEMWTPYLEESATFGSQVLKVKVRPAARFENKVEVQVHGLSDNDWQTLNARLLNVPGMPATALKESEALQVGEDRILLRPEHRGLLFSRGILVQKLPNEYAYGYDLAHVRLDRDRKAPDAWSLQTEIADLIRRALDAKLLQPEQVLKLFDRETGEARIIGDYYVYRSSDALTQALTAAFKAMHGDDVAPVVSMGESLRAEQHGLKGKIVSKALKTVIEHDLGDFEKRLASRSLDAERFYTMGDLTAQERETLLWASRLVSLVEPRYSMKDLNVVDFYGAVRGSYGPDQGVRIARKLLTSKEELLTTLVHEVAHMVGSMVDGSVEHMDMQMSIMSRLVITLTSSADRA